MPEQILSIPNKPEISNYGSKLLLAVNGPGLRDVHCSFGRLARGRKPQGALKLLKENGEVIEAKQTRCEWKPYVIESEYEFPNGLKIKQRSWVDDPFVHAAVSFDGSLDGAKLIAQGESYMEAKALVSPQNSVIVEEMHPSFKPFVLEISSSEAPDRVLLSSDGKTWKETDFAWSEGIVHYRMVFDKLPSGLTMSAHLGKLSNFLPAGEWDRARSRELDVKATWEKAYNEELPIIECPDKRYKDVMQFSFYVHLSGVLCLEGMLPYPFVVPSKVTYPMWWLWDTAFHSIMDAWMRDPSLAFGALLNHTIMQSAKGCIQDAAGEFYADTAELKWVHPEQYDDHPPCTSLCVNGLATWDVYQKTGDIGFLKRMYPNLVKYERWLTDVKASKSDPDLVAFYCWCDVGWDDSKRWGKSGFPGGGADHIDWELPVTPVDANVFLSLLRDTLSKTAGLLGETDHEREYAESAARTRDAIERLMWNEDEGFFFDLLPDGKQESVWTPAGFVPLMIGMADADRYQRMKKHLLDTKKFWTRYPLPTLSADDPDFATDIWWRGGTWPVVNWQVNEGLFKYDPEMGLRLLDATIDMMTKDGYPTCREFYSPIDGKGGGAIDQGWATMPVDLILRRIYGLNLRPDGLMLDPHIQADWPEASVRNIFVAGTQIEVHYRRIGNKLEAVVKNVGKKQLTVTAGDKKFTIAPGVESTLEI